MSDTENNQKQNGETVWIASSDKKYILTYSDKELMESLFSSYCRDISFEEGFEKAFEKECMESVLNELNQVYSCYLEDIIASFQNTLEVCTDKLINTEGSVSCDVIDYHSKILTVKQYKLTYTKYKCLIKLLKNTKFKDDSTLQDFQDKTAHAFSEILSWLKKIDKQTEHEQIIPEYTKELIKNGYIEKDGITAIASLDNIAEFLYGLKLDVFNFKTLLQYRQHDGKPFSENSAKEAVKRANHA